MVRWEIAILKIIREQDGLVSTQAIYGEIEEGTYIKLTEEHLQNTVYGGRPAYQHEVRSYLSSLTKAGYLRRESRGTYIITEAGRKRIDKNT